MIRKLPKTKDPLDIILNGHTKMKDHPNHIKALTIKTAKEENFRVKNPITGKETDIVISRQGTTDEKLAMVLLAPDATKEQKDSMLAGYLFERGRENASFITELFLSKGTHVKETQAFKRQIRFDFESFANTMVFLFQDLSNDIIASDDVDSIQATLLRIKERLGKGAELLTKQREQITLARMKEKGFGVYLDRQGRAFSIEDDEIVDVVKKEKEELKNEREI